MSHLWKLNNQNYASHFKVLSVRNFGTLSSKQDVFLRPLPSRLGKLCRGRKWWESCRKDKEGDTKERGIDSHVSSAVAALTGPAQVRARWIPSAEGQVDLGPITIPETISSDNCLRRQNQFSRITESFFHWVHKPHFLVGPMSSKQMVNTK